MFISYDDVNDKFHIFLMSNYNSGFESKLKDSIDDAKKLNALNKVKRSRTEERDETVPEKKLYMPIIIGFLTHRLSSLEGMYYTLLASFGKIPNKLSDWNLASKKLEETFSRVENHLKTMIKDTISEKIPINEINSLFGASQDYEEDIVGIVNALTYYYDLPSIETHSSENNEGQSGPAANEGQSGPAANEVGSDEDQSSTEGDQEFSNAPPLTRERNILEGYQTDIYDVIDEKNGLDKDDYSFMQNLIYRHITICKNENLPHNIEHRLYGLNKDEIDSINTPTFLLQDINLFENQDYRTKLINWFIQEFSENDQVKTILDDFIRLPVQDTRESQHLGQLMQLIGAEKFKEVHDNFKSSQHRQSAANPVTLNPNEEP